MTPEHERSVEKRQHIHFCSNFEPCPTDCGCWCHEQNAARQQAMQGLQARVKELEAQVEVGLQISGSFFEALKPLKLEQININNPGAHVTELTQKLAYRKGEIKRRDEFLERRGYRRCDIAACNCESWHGGHEQQRADRLQAEVERLQRLAVHCPDCGGDYAATGLEVGCPCKLRAEVERLVLGLTWMAGYIIKERKGTPDTAGWIQAALRMADLQKKDQTDQRAEMERLNKLSTCRCGNVFTAKDPGTCGNCLATYYKDHVKTGTVMAKVDR